MDIETLVWWLLAQIDFPTTMKHYSKLLSRKDGWHYGE